MGIAAKGIRSAAAATLLLVVSPAAAQAGTVEAGVRGVSPGPQQVLEYAAAPGERNRVTVTLAGGAYVVDDAAGVTPGVGCTREDPGVATRARCPVEGSSQGPVALLLGDGDDQATLIGTAGAVRGEAGNDLLAGGSEDDALIGGPGTDVLVGGAGVDALDAGGGAASSERSADRLDGGAGADDLVGSAGANRLTGGTGVDSLTGGGGADRLLARDRFVDRVNCGAGRDSAALDGLDWFRSGCERVRRSDRGGATLLEIRSPRTDARSARLTIGCPGDASGCQGRVRLRDGGRTLGVGSFRVRRGATRRVSIRLPSDFARRVARGGGGRLTVLLYSRTGRRTRTVILREFMPVPSLTPEQ
jgi:RTX calcium-binding nonapeptide repeat (4 copies)